MTDYAAYLRPLRQITLRDFMVAHGLNHIEAGKVLRAHGWKALERGGKRTWRRAGAIALPGHNTTWAARAAGKRGAKASPWGRWRGATT